MEVEEKRMKEGNNESRETHDCLNTIQASETQSVVRRPTRTGDIIVVSFYKEKRCIECFNILQKKICVSRRILQNNVSQPGVRELRVQVRHFYRSINPLTPNDHYSGRTAPLKSKRRILYIYSTNMGTEYFNLLTPELFF